MTFCQILFSWELTTRKELYDVAPDISRKVEGFDSIAASVRFVYFDGS
jgi:hypothetical protein